MSVRTFLPTSKAGLGQSPDSPEQIYFNKVKSRLSNRKKFSIIETMIKRILHKQTNSIGGATGILAVSYIISGILGILRDRLLNSVFGVGIDTSIYLAAFRIPDFIYNILILGGVLVAFLPIFAEYFSEREEKAWEMANYVLNIFLFFLFFSSLILFFLSPWLMPFLAPGFSPENKDKLLDLVQLLFLSPILLGVSSIFSAILQHFHRFVIFSLAPIFYNIGIILGIVFLAPHFGIFGAGLGVVIGAFMHLAVQIPSAVGCGFKYKPVFSFRYPAISRIFRLMAPRIVAVLSNQINLFILTAVASGLADNAIAVFNFARNIQWLPVGVLGMSLATAVFPHFSRLWANGEKKKFVDKFYGIFSQSLFVMIPVSVFTLILNNQITLLILGKMDFEAEKLISVSLAILSFSILAWSLIPLVMRAFFSFQNSKIPALISVSAVFMNLVMSFLFIWLLGFQNIFSDFIRNIAGLSEIKNIAVLGLSLAFSLSSIAQTLLLLMFLCKEIGDFGIKPLFNSFIKTALVSMVAGIVVFLVLNITSVIFNTNIFLELFFQAFLAGGAGFLVFFLICLLLKMSELNSLIFSLKMIFRKNNG